MPTTRPWTGKRAFEGETVTETLAAILKGEPDWKALPANTPQHIRFVLRRCLVKDIKRGFRDNADVRIIIEEGRSVHEAQVAVRKPWLRPGWGLAAIMFIALIVIAFIHFGEKSSAPPQTIRFKVNLGNGNTFNISPDGRHLVYPANDSDGISRLWLRSLDSLDARPLPGTESVHASFWSPDSRFIAFSSGGKLKKINVSGGSSQVLCSLPESDPFTGGSWNQDSGNEAETTASQELIWVDRQGKKIQSAAPLDQYGNFRLSGDDNRIVFDRGDTTNLSDIWVLDLIRGVPSRLTFDPRIYGLPRSSTIRNHFLIRSHSSMNRRAHSLPTANGSHMFRTRRGGMRSTYNRFLFPAKNSRFRPEADRNHTGASMARNCIICRAIGT